MTDKTMTKVVSTKKQLKMLVQLLSENPQIAKGLCSKPEAQKKFQQFAIELNKLGPPEREWHKWMRVWTDLKCKVKKRRFDNEYTPGQGETPLSYPKRPYTELETAIIEILDLDASVLSSLNKHPKIEESRLSDNNHDERNFDEANFDETMYKYVPYDSMEQPDDEFPPRTMKNEPHSPGVESRRKTPSPAQDDFRKVLEDQAAAQKQFYEKITDLMGDIRRSMNNVEDYIKKSVRQKETLLELKKDKLRVYKATKMNQRIDMKTKLKIKSELVEIKRKKQEALNKNEET